MRNYTDGKSAEQLIGHIGFGGPVEVDTSSVKKVLITGAGSYIGESFSSYASKNYPALEVNSIDMLDGSWRDKDFSSYDIVYHVAGIAHADVGNVSEETKEKYYKVNTDLAVEVCNKAKAEGVKEFIFMSSMIVYGDSAPYGVKKVVDEHTVPHPANFYGDSKLQADVAVRDLADDKFKVVVLRPPMIYGKGSKGNYPTLAKLAMKLPIFPDVDNERSMLHIDNLCEFLCQMMLVKEVKEKKVGGKEENEIVLIPQNAEWTKTSEMVREIAGVGGKSIKLLKVLNPAVWLGSKVPGKIGRLLNKAFGNSCYAHEVSVYEGIDYQKVDLKESIRRTEGREPSDKEDHTSSENKVVNMHKRTEGREPREKEEKPKALMLASVASMIDLFNADNINILRDLGYRVDVACNFEEGSITSQERVDEYKKELNEQGISTYQIPIPRSLSRINDIARSYKIVKQLVSENEYKIVHCHSPIGSVICRLACIDARKKGTKVIYTAHGFHFFEGASKTAWMVYCPIEKECSKFTDVLITINQEDYKRAQQFYAKKVEYVPGIGVHTEAFHNALIDRTAKRKEFGFNGYDFVFMSTGQISIRKNHEVIIRALSKLNNHKVKYLIVGFGEEETRLKQLTEDLGVSSQVVFAGYRNDVKELLHCADAFAFPSLQEGLPVALMEAMSVGLPVVCSRIRGNTDLIEDGKGGFLFEPHDVDGFVAGMKQIVSGDCKQMGDINVETMKRFDIHAVNKKMSDIYRNI